MSLLLLLNTQTPQQAVSGTLSFAGAVTVRVRTPVALTGTLTSTGTLATVVRFARTVAGTLTSSATLDSTYVPPSGGDLLTTLFRRNQTD